MENDSFHRDSFRAEPRMTVGVDNYDQQPHITEMDEEDDESPDLVTDLKNYEAAYHTQIISSDIKHRTSEIIP